MAEGWREGVVLGLRAVVGMGCGGGKRGCEGGGARG